MLAFHAHALKSMSLNLGAKRIVELSQKLEDLGRARNVHGAPALLQELENAFAQTKAQLLAAPRPMTVTRLGPATPMPCLMPARLNYGDTIGIIAPASAPPDPKNIDRSVAVLERLGFKPKLAPNVRKRWGFLAGSDRDRASDLMKMFADRKVKAIICVRGGYGTSRLLPLLDYRAIRANPKIFIGYSDITSLHCAFLVKSNLVSFHGPMLNSDFVKQDLPDFTLQSFLKTLMQPSAPGSIRDGYKRKTVTILRRGIVSGPLMGGNHHPALRRARDPLSALLQEPYPLLRRPGRSALPLRPDADPIAQRRPAPASRRHCHRHQCKLP